MGWKCSSQPVRRNGQVFLDGLLSALQDSGSTGPSLATAVQASNWVPLSRKSRVLVQTRSTKKPHYWLSYSVTASFLICSLSRTPALTHCPAEVVRGPSGRDSKGSEVGHTSDFQGQDLVCPHCPDSPLRADHKPSQAPK